MKARPTKRKKSITARARKSAVKLNYHAWSGNITVLLEEARRQAARSVNAILTATYWEIGRRIVEFEQQGQNRADYGEVLLQQLGADLTRKFGRGFAWRNLFRMRAFFLAYENILPTLSAKSGTEAPGGRAGKLPTLSAISRAPLHRPEIGLVFYLENLSSAFSLSWSHYVRLLSVEDPEARRFYETESMRGGWSVRQLDRQIGTLFYERTALSKDKAMMLTARGKARSEDAVSVEEEIKNPFVLEFLGLRDDYAESDLEDALVRHLESFLLELGNGFAFVARQKRIRVDAGQMNLYVNYAAEHLALAEENPPVGLVLCSEHDDAVAHYAMGNLHNHVLAAQYRVNLPDPKTLATEIEKTRRLLESRTRFGNNNLRTRHSSQRLGND